jgi:hypothetical protein
LEGGFGVVLDLICFKMQVPLNDFMSRGSTQARCI